MSLANAGRFSSPVFVISFFFSLLHLLLLRVSVLRVVRPRGMFVANAGCFSSPVFLFIFFLLCRLFVSICPCFSLSFVIFLFIGPYFFRSPMRAEGSRAPANVTCLSSFICGLFCCLYVCVWSFFRSLLRAEGSRAIPFTIFLLFCFNFILVLLFRPSSLFAYCLSYCLSVCLSVCASVCLSLPLLLSLLPCDHARARPHCVFVCL